MPIGAKDRPDMRKMTQNEPSQANKIRSRITDQINQRRV